MLLRNFPRTECGKLDWSSFERGPPDYLVEFMQVLEELARKTMPNLISAQCALGLPAWEDVPKCATDWQNPGKYIYEPRDWERQALASFSRTPRKRVRSKGAPASPIVLGMYSDAGPPRDAEKKRRRNDSIPPAAKTMAPQGVSSQELAGAADSMVPGWWCELLGRHVGLPLSPSEPSWFNDARCGAVHPTRGTQLGLTCGLFAVNHCLAIGRVPCIHLTEFEAIAGDGLYVEGDFDDVGLQRNLASRGCRFERLEGVEHQDMARQLNKNGLLALFQGQGCLGCIMHQPCPRHWIALVPPARHESERVAALLCDSLKPRVYALSVEDVASMLSRMGSMQMRAGESEASLWEQEQEAAGWCAYLVFKDDLA